MGLFKKNKTSNVHRGNRVEYDRGGEEIENTEMMSEKEECKTGILYEMDEELETDYDTILINIDKLQIQGDFLSLARNALCVKRNDCSMDGRIQSMGSDELFDRLLELKGIYGAGDYIRFLIQHIYNVGFEMEKENILHAEESEQIPEPIQRETAYHTELIEESTKMKSMDITMEESLQEENNLEDEEVQNIVLEIVDYEGKSSLYLLTDLSISEDEEILDMLVEENSDAHISDFLGFLESCGAIIEDGSMYDREDIYCSYYADSNEWV